MLLLVLKLLEWYQLPLPLLHPWAWRFDTTALTPPTNLRSPNLSFLWLEQACFPVHVTVRKLMVYVCVPFVIPNPALQTFLMLFSLCKTTSAEALCHLFHNDTKIMQSLPKCQLLPCSQKEKKDFWSELVIHPAPHLLLLLKNIAHWREIVLYFMNAHCWR